MTHHTKQVEPPGIKLKAEVANLRRRLEDEAKLSAILQDALECIVECGSAENETAGVDIARETLEAIATRKS